MSYVVEYIDKCQSCGKVSSLSVVGGKLVCRGCRKQYWEHPGGAFVTPTITQTEEPATAEPVNHSLERTSPFGERFTGRCVNCGATELPSSAAMQLCPNPRRKSANELLLDAVIGPPVAQTKEPVELISDKHARDFIQQPMKITPEDLKAFRDDQDRVLLEKYLKCPTCASELEGAAGQCPVCSEVFK
jgi:hypothetical protein